MNDEVAMPSVTRRHALKAGCCMWSPILPVAQSSDADSVAVAASSGNAVPNSTRLDEQADRVAETVDA